MQRVFQRVGVDDRRYGAVFRLGLQQQPGIGLLRIQRACEGEPAATKKIRCGREDPWIAWLIEIQAAHVVSRTQAEARDAGLFAERGEIQVVLTGCGIRIVLERQNRFGQEGIATVAGFRVA